MEVQKFDDNESEPNTRTSTIIDIEEPKRKGRNKKKMPTDKKKKKAVSAKEKKPLKSKAKQGTSEIAMKSERIKRKRTGIHDIYDDVEAKFTVMEKAERVLASSVDDTPYFLKCMLPSNVTYSFWLIIPKRFCLHLPSQDSTVTLVDEWGKEYRTTYLIDRHGLSAGWRGFSISHRLLKGDILIFRLIEPCKLKVHIVRVNGLDVVNAALCLMNMDAFGKTTDSDLAKQDNRKRRRTKKYKEPMLLDMPKLEDSVQEKCNDASDSKLVIVADQSQNNSDGFGSEVLEGSEIADNLVSSDHRCTETSFYVNVPVRVSYVVRLQKNLCFLTLGMR